MDLFAGLSGNRKGEYRIMAESILRCLDESFEVDGFYISAHDADTEHEEGPLISGVLTSLKMLWILKSSHCFLSPITLQGRVILKEGII